MRESAPTPNGEDPLQYILDLGEYLSEPDRRRLGSDTFRHVQHAVAALRQPSPAPLMAMLAVAAEQPIEDMTDLDVMKEALLTAQDIASRLEEVLRANKTWWTR